MSLQDIRAAVAAIPESERYRTFMRLARSDGSLTKAERQWVEANDRALKAVLADVPTTEIAAAAREHLESARAALSDCERAPADIEAQHRRAVEDVEAQYERAKAEVEAQHQRAIEEAATRHRTAEQALAEAGERVAAVQERIAAIEAERTESKRELESATRQLAPQ